MIEIPKLNQKNTKWNHEYVRISQNIRLETKSYRISCRKLMVKYDRT